MSPTKSFAEPQKPTELPRKDSMAQFELAIRGTHLHREGGMTSISPVLRLRIATPFGCPGSRLMAGIHPSATGRTALVGPPSNRVRRAAWKVARHREARVLRARH